MTVRAYKLGALGQDDLTGVKCLVAGSSTATNYVTFETPVGTDYQVTAGKTFYITKITFNGASPGQDAAVIIGYGDTGVADGGNPPTNYVAMTSRFVMLGTLAQTPLERDCLVPIPAQKYPCIYVVANQAYVTAYGIEV